MVFYGASSTYRSPPFVVFRTRLVLNIGGFGWGWVKMCIFWARTAWRGLFFDGAIYRGSLFSVRNAKTGPVGARIHVEGSNSVQRDIFTMREDPRVGPKDPLGRSFCSPCPSISRSGALGPKGPLTRSVTFLLTIF